MSINWRKVLLVARNDLFNYLRRPSFLIVTLGLPLIGIIVALFSGVMSPANQTIDSVAQISIIEEQIRPQDEQIGLVDASGFIQHIPSSLEGTFLRYETVEAAETALHTGEIKLYFHVPADYLAQGEVERVAQHLDLFPQDTSSIEFLLRSNLLNEVDPAYRDRVEQPISAELLEVEYLVPVDDDATIKEDTKLTFGLAYISAMLLYSTIFMAAAFLLQSVATEKENRIMELLLTSIRPMELLTGKVIGLGLLGLGQTIIWALSAYLAAWLSLSNVSLNALGIGWQLGAMILLYFLLGYGLFSVMMAGVGALVPSARASGPATMLVILPAIVPLMLLGPLTERPHSSLAVLLSLIPFTAPLTMIVRLSQGGVPRWQIAASVLIMGLSIPLLLRLVARIFQAQILLSSAEFSLRRVFAILRQNDRF